MDIQIDVKATLKATKPPHPPFWQKINKKQQPTDEAGSQEPDDEAPVFTMAWDEESRALTMKAPAGIMAFIVETVEKFARENGYAQITRKVTEAQMKESEMNLDDFL